MRILVRSFSVIGLLTAVLLLGSGPAYTAGVNGTILAEGYPLDDPVGVAVSPDGGTLYISDYWDNAVYSMPASGGALTLLDSGYHLNNLRNIAISPDGSTLYIAGFWTNDIKALPVSGGTATTLTSVYSPTSVAVSADGSTLYVTSNYGSAVYSTPAAGGPLTVLAQGNPFGTAGAGPNGVDISNDGSTLYISAGDSGIFTLPSSGGIPTQIYVASSTIIPGMLSLSKDGNTIFFVDVSANRNGDPSAIYSIPVSGGTASLVYQGPLLSTSGYLSLSPDGTKLYYADPGYLDRYQKGPEGVAGRVITFDLGSNLEPVADAGADQEIQTCAPTVEVSLDGSGSYDPDEDQLSYEWIWASGSAEGVSPSVTLPAGTTTITLTVTDSNGASASDTVDITVIDPDAPIIEVSVAPNLLWPPNHRLIEVSPSVSVSDSCSENVSVELLSITSSEPDDDTGDGRTEGDIIVGDGSTIQLRAERSGGGAGRTYTITFRATDEAGNYTDGTAVVTVPLSRSQSKTLKGQAPQSSTDYKKQRRNRYR